MTSLRLEPTSAALSIARRLQTIAQCKAMIKATVARYDGLTAFQKELDKHGVSAQVAALVAEQEG